MYAYLSAKQSKSDFVLRIEDTDQERSVPGAIENILEVLHWAGIGPDEGVVLEKGVVTQKGSKGPYIQSERLDLYKQYAEQLLKSGNAYRCFCSPERLDEMRKGQQAKKQPPMYDRLCCSLSEEEVKKRVDAGENHVIRMKIPREQLITFNDEIRGKVEFRGDTIDDQVLMKSDGFPTYHLAHVVDDHLMDINIIIRGEEWISSLPKHLLLFQFFGWKEPRYAHVPLLLNKDKSKLSKRQNDVATRDYIDKGYLPEALINFLALLGWNPGTTEEIFTMEDLIKRFSLDRVQKSGAIFDLEKLDWLQGQWIRRIPIKEFAERIQPIVAEKYLDAKRDSEFEEKAALIQERITFFPEAAKMFSYFYEEPKVKKDLILNEKQKVAEDKAAEYLSATIEALESIDEKKWNEETLKEILFDLVEKKKYKRGQILWPMRAALTGLPYSPGAFEVANLLGKKTSIDRLKATQALF